MHRLLYISTIRGQLSRTQLETILQTARRRNAAVGITGLLVAGGRRFLQALEGPGAAVFETFDRICKDPAHFGIVELTRGPITERAFGDWSMGYRLGGSAGDEISVPSSVARLIEPLADPTLRAYFSGFAEMHAGTS
jgi:hypothetical protein